MSLEITYEFSYDGYPYIHMITNFDGQELSRAALNLEQEYNSIPSNILNDFSQFLSNEFNTIISTLVEENLDYDAFNRSIEPMRTICRIKSGCDKVIYDRENPPTNDNPYPPLVEA